MAPIFVRGQREKGDDYLEKFPGLAVLCEQAEKERLQEERQEDYYKEFPGLAVLCEQAEKERLQEEKFPGLAVLCEQAEKERLQEEKFPGLAVLCEQAEKERLQEDRQEDYYKDDEDMEDIEELSHKEDSGDDEDLELQKALYYSARMIAVPNCTDDMLADENRRRKGKAISSSVEYVSNKESQTQSVYEDGDCSYGICEICTDKLARGDMMECLPCYHSFCRGCIATYVGEKAQENVITGKCPVAKCEQEFLLEAFRDIVPDDVFERWRRAACEASALALPDYIECPFKDCGALFVDDERGYLIRACPKCWKIFCMKCRVSWHMGIKCHQYERSKSRKRNREISYHQQAKEIDENALPLRPRVMINCHSDYFQH